MDRKYGIKKLELTEKYPDFIADNAAHTVRWFIKRDIRSIIQTFLIQIAKIKYKEFDCYCCSYPTKYASDYFVFVDIDNAKEFLLLSSIDTEQYTNSGKRIDKLKEELYIFDVAQEQLLNLHQEIADQLYPDEQSHH